MTIASNQQIQDFVSTQNIPLSSTMLVAPDGTIVFAVSGTTSSQLNLNAINTNGTGDRTVLSNDAVVAIIPPNPPNTTEPINPPIITPVLPPTSSISNGRLQLVIKIGVYQHPIPIQLRLPIKINVLPAIPVFASYSIDFPFSLEIKPIPLPIKYSIINVAKQLWKDKIQDFFDNERVGKTLLNFGQDFQAPIINWQYDVLDSSGATILVKLYRPLPPEITTFTNLWIARELSPTQIDQLSVIFIPQQGVQLYLRPPNTNIKVQSLDGAEVNDVTLQTLLSTGSFDEIKPTDPVLESWFVTALEGIELNVDYSDFSNFVFYSSATQRIEAFKQKLLLLENYNTIISAQSASIASATSAGGLPAFTASLSYPALESIASQRLDVIRSLDGYERFLYYSSSISYSSSFSNELEDQLYFLGDATWPKISGSVITVQSASNGTLYSINPDQVIPIDNLTQPISWISAIEHIASEYDKQNQNRLSNSVPEYIKNDNLSEDFIIFLDMIGHHFDILKSYTDAMTLIYNRDSDPFKNLSPDIIWNVAKSFGIDLPNQYAVKSLLEYTIGSSSVSNPTVYREAAAETWKRFLHNQMYLLKTKGTKGALRGLMNAYGILPSVIQVRETATPSFYLTQSYEEFQEQTNALFISSSYITIPWTPTTHLSASSLEVRFSSTNNSSTSTLVNGGNLWSILLNPLTGSWGYVSITSGSVVQLSSSNFELYNGDFYSIMTELTGNLLSLLVKHAGPQSNIINSYIGYGITIDNSFVGTELGDITQFNYGLLYDDGRSYADNRSIADGTFISSSTILSSSIADVWDLPSNIFLGSSGSTLGTPFIGLIDEFRVWGEVLTEDTFNNHVLYPGLYNGNVSSSAKDSLYVRLSFNKPYNLGILTSSLQFAPNESPYINNSGSSPLLIHFSASGFANEPTYPYSMDILNRNVLRYSLNAGGNQYVSNKIVVEDPPILKYLDISSGSAIPVLSHDKSILTIDDKFNKVISNNKIGFYFSPVDAINDSIIRSIGNIDIQTYIGDPSSLYSSSYSALEKLNELYWSSYAYSYNFNEFMLFISDLLNPLFIQAQQLVPARAKLLTGIVLEPSILERNKIQWNPLNFSGLNTYQPNINPTLEADFPSPAPTEVISDYLTFETEIDQSNTDIIESLIESLNSEIDTQTENLVDGLDLTLDSTIIATTTQSIDAEVETYNSIFELASEDVIEATVLSIDDIADRNNYINFLLQRFDAPNITAIAAQNQEIFNQLLALYQPGSLVSVQTGMNVYVGDNIFTETIQPYIDFTDIGVTTYFMQKDGIVLVPTQEQVRVNQNILVAEGNWVKGNVYTNNQYVTQSNQVGAAAVGNGFEYVCISPLQSGSFISNNPPSLDVVNWKRMQYVLTNVLEVRIASLISGSVELVNSGSGYAPFIGYMPDHYRFRRDNRTGTKRRLWLGCKETDTDGAPPFGGPPIQVFTSANSTLYVTTNVGALPQPNPVSGPILDVR